MAERTLYTPVEVVRIARAYCNLASIVGNTRGLGTEMFDPSMNVLEVLRKVKTEAYESIPEKIREQTPEIFNELNENDQVTFIYVKGNVQVIEKRQ